MLNAKKNLMMVITRKQLLVPAVIDQIEYDMVTLYCTKLGYPRWNVFGILLGKSQ